MDRTPEFRTALDLPKELRSYGSLNAFEDGPHSVKVAFRMSDPNLEIGQTTILRVSMVEDGPAEVLFSVDAFSMGFHTRTNSQELLVQSGSIAHLRQDEAWHSERINTSFLRDGHVSDSGMAWVFGSEGAIFFRSNDTWESASLESDTAIRAMGGSAKLGLFAGGENGTLYRRDGIAWQHVDTGFGVDIRGISGNEKSLHLACERGIFGVLENSEMRILESDLSSDFLSIAEFREKIFVCDSSFGISTISGDELLPFANLGYVYRLNSTVDWITANASQYVVQFNGEEWRGVEIFYDDGYRSKAIDMSGLKWGDI